MVKKTPSSRKPSTRPAAQPEQTSTPISLQTATEQQRLLNLFSDAFGNLLSSDRFPALLQEVKQALFNRDFAAAFGREDYLEAYAARWSPTRALCFATVLLGIKNHLINITDFGNGSGPTGRGHLIGGDEINENEAGEVSSSTGAAARRGTLRMVCIGGCVAEHLAFASYVESQSLTGFLTLLDSAPWSSVAALIESKTTSPPPLSKYASSAAKSSNKAMLEYDQLTLTFTQQDILSLDVPALAAALGDEPVVVTLMFTLNELYTGGGIAKTTKLLKDFGQVLVNGSLVLVVDSPGSYSEAAIGKQKKRYPMQWLLDHTLLETETEGYSWEKLRSDESIWFRMLDGLTYPIPLENMRYQLHLYRLEKSS